MRQRLNSLLDLVRRVIAFLRTAYARGREIQFEQEELRARERAEKRAQRRKMLRQRTARARAVFKRALSIHTLGAALCFVLRWSWRVACVVLWLSFTHFIRGHHLSDLEVGAWTLLTLLIYAIGAGIGIVGRALIGQLIVPGIKIIVSELIEYRRWKKEHGHAAG